LETGELASLYEARLDPFDEFSRLEQRRRLDELSVADRILYTTIQTAISSRLGRKCVLIYLAAMHALIFSIIWWAAHRTHCDPGAAHEA
jgi:hypothetical protein